MQKKKETLGQVAKQPMVWHEGRIVFTNSKGLVGVGLSRKARRTTPKTRITTSDGITKDGEFKVENGTTIAMTVIDDTHPGSPRQVTRTYTVPFARANWEEDYSMDWTFFEKNAEGIE